MKLIGLEFDVSDLSRKQNARVAISKAKDHYKKIYKELSLDLSGRGWELSENGDKVCVQVADLYDQPK